MREKHKAFIASSRASYDRRIRYRAELYCLVRGHNWVQSAVEYLATKVRYTDVCRHCGRKRIELVTEK